MRIATLALGVMLAAGAAWADPSLLNQNCGSSHVGCDGRGDGDGQKTYVGKPGSGERRREKAAETRRRTGERVHIFESHSEVRIYQVPADYPSK